ncbi:MAG: MlaD family protein [Motiliproteus sp.]
MVDNPEFPSARVSPHERLSTFWLLPVLAIILGGWLFYKNHTEADIQVQIQFTDGQGLVAGKTEVRYQGTPIGLIKKFKLNADLEGVTATVSFDKSAERLLRAGTQFWLVKPQVSLQGISGLETLLSGEYISLRPGDGEPTYRFQARTEPPPLGNDDPGVNIRLRAATLGSLQFGSPVHYRQLQVGDIQGYELAEDGQGVLININIRDQYTSLVRSNSRFWNNSGLRLKGGLAGLTLQTDSLTSLLIGGISFETPDSDPIAAIADNDRIYELHDDYETANTGVLIRVGFETAQGLEAGVTPVMFKGLRVGTLTKLDYDKPQDKVVAEFKLTPEAEAELNENTRLWLVKPRLTASGISGLETLFKGNHIQIEFSPGQQGPVYDFTALPAPPASSPTDTGLSLTLNARTLGSLQQGAPIYFRKLQVGEVQDYALSSDGQQVQIRIHIRAQYAPLVKRNSRFWNNSGIRIQGGLSGLSVQSDSLASMLIGGINFDLGSGQKPGPDANSDDQFSLYDDVQQAQVGSVVRVTFSAAEGLTAGITPVQIRGITVGTVTDLELSKGLDSVTAVIKLAPQAGNALNANSRFWIVKAQLGLEGVSGLETLIKGNYIEVDVGKSKGRGKGRPSRYTALEQPPTLDPSAPGLHLKLLTRDASGLTRGAPIYYRQIQVGSIQSVTLTDHGQQIAVGIHIQQGYARLVNRDSRFWSSSGLSMQLGLAGLTLDVAPLRALLLGGISFDNAINPNAPLVANGAQFPLHPDRRSALEDGVRIQIGFASADSLGVDAPLRFQGIDIGRVLEIKLDPDSHRVTVDALVQRAYQSLIRAGSNFWVAKPSLGLSRAENLETLLTGGYIQLKPGTGAPQARFTGLEREPFWLDNGNGIGFILESPKLGSLQKGSPVYFRQIPIGTVAGFGLASDARQVEIHINIESRYAPLVREDSRFWNVSGIKMNFNLLGGAKISTESVESVLAGGIALATPDTTPLTPPADPNRRFLLHPEAKPEWQQWAPRIQIARQP